MHIGRDLTGSAIGHYPVIPVSIIEQKTPAQFNGIDAKKIENILIDNGQLLDHVVNPHRLFPESQV